jgi:hypothetical protein
VKNCFKTIKEVTIHSATFEQIKFINYQNSLGENQFHPIIKTEFILRNPNIGAFERSIEMLTKRHESLRTYFQINSVEIKQCVIPYRKDIFALSYHDIGKEENSRSIINNILDKCEKDLRKINIPPLFKFLIFNVDNNESYICLLIHHIISDEWSVNIILRELREYYYSFTESKSVIIKPLKMQLSDYAFYQKKMMQEKGNKAHNYWQSKLDSILKYNLCKEVNYSKIQFSFGKIDELSGKSNYKVELLNTLNNIKPFFCNSYIDLDLYNRLEIVASICKISMCTIIITSLQLLFYLLFDRKKPLIPMLILNRRIPGTEEIIGCLLGGIYLYQPIRQKLSFKKFAKITYMDFIKSSRYLIFDHNDMGLTEDILRLRSDVYLNFVSKKIIGKNNIHKRMVTGKHFVLRDPEFYALSSTIIEYKDCMLITWKYNPCFYSSAIIDCMVDNHLKILHSIAQNSEIIIKDMMENIGKPVI